VEAPDSQYDAYQHPDKKPQEQKVNAPLFCRVYRMIFSRSASNENAEGKNDYHEYWQYG
jgi:hypothetical protein